MADIGDIVETHGERWAVMGTESNPAGHPPRFVLGRYHKGLPSSLVVNAGGLAAVETPTFTPGQVVRYRGETMTILTVGSETIRASYTKRRYLEDGNFIDLPGEIDIPLGELVRETEL